MRGDSDIGRGLKILITNLCHSLIKVSKCANFIFRKVIAEAPSSAQQFLSVTRATSEPGNMLGPNGAARKCISINKISSNSSNLVKPLAEEGSSCKVEHISIKHLHTQTNPTKQGLLFGSTILNAQVSQQGQPVCVSCVRFSSTAAALNPAIVASSQPCSSCSGSTCQLCLKPCRGCSSLMCGNCSIDIESFSGYRAEMFIVCLGCRDRFETDSSGGSGMDIA